MASSASSWTTPSQVGAALLTRARPEHGEPDGIILKASALSLARHGQGARHPRLEGQGRGRRQDHVRPVVLRHPVLRRRLEAVPLLAVPALPAHLQEPAAAAAEELKVITTHFTVAL